MAAWLVGDGAHSGTARFSSQIFRPGVTDRPPAARPVQGSIRYSWSLTITMWN